MKKLKLMMVAAMALVGMSVAANEITVEQVNPSDVNLDALMSVDEMDRLFAVEDASQATPSVELQYGPHYGPRHPGPRYRHPRHPRRPGYGPGYGRRPLRVACYATNARGHVFRAVGRRGRQFRVQRRAMGKCYSYSRRCFRDGCEVIGPRGGYRY